MSNPSVRWKAIILLNKSYYLHYGAKLQEKEKENISNRLQINALILKAGSTNTIQFFQTAYGVTGSTTNQIINPPRPDII
ncbi:hypothetical protein [Pseudanabaena sp. PCC 6802]|uniref:hypothetical protein n=1 Tax=Pseudanabaena sp. PCC 6802 TaxID=118173 RepID=UPI0003716300|nr:hypothetical protein [Pseudanabaena sp. PCC 6802]